MESHSSDMYIRLNPDGTFRVLRVYSKDHLVRLEIAYHKEGNIDPSQKPVLHYHVYKYGSQYEDGMDRSKAIPITQELYDKFKKYFRGVK